MDILAADFEKQYTCAPLPTQYDVKQVLNLEVTSMLPNEVPQQRTIEKTLD